jgi:hypothetical protein
MLGAECLRPECFDALFHHRAGNRYV